MLRKPHFRLPGLSSSFARSPRTAATARRKTAAWNGSSPPSSSCEEGDSRCRVQGLGFRVYRNCIGFGSRVLSEIDRKFCLLLLISHFGLRGLSEIDRKFCFLGWAGRGCGAVGWAGGWLWAPGLGVGLGWAGLGMVWVGLGWAGAVWAGALHNLMTIRNY